MERSRCQKVGRLFWWLRVSLTFGDAITDDGRLAPRQGGAVDDQRGTAEQVTYNGKIASIQLLLLLVIVSFTMSIWQFLTESYGVIKTITLTFFMLIGLCVLIYFNINRSRVLSPQQGANDGVNRILSAAASPPIFPRRDNLTLFGITTFYFLGCIMDIFQVLLTTSCSGVWSTCQNSYYTITNAVVVMFHVVRIAFLGSQTLFCIVFNRATFIDRATIRCGLTCVAAINMCLWFDFLVGIMFHLLRFERPVDNLKFPCYANASNASADAVACLMQNTTMHRFLDTYMTPIFLPFSIEIAVLIGECLYHLFCHCANSPTVNTVNSIRNPSAKGDEVVGNHPDDDEAEFYAEPEDTRLTRQFQVNSDVCDESSHLLSNSSVLLSVNTTRLRWQVSFLLLFVTNAFLLALAVLYRIHSATRIYLYYKCPFYLLMTLAIVLGYNTSRGFRVLRDLPFTVIDYLLLFASFGQLNLNLLSFIAYSNSAHPKVFFATQKFLEMLQTYLQATFALYASRVVPTQPDRTAEKSSSLAEVFKYVVFYLAVSNGTLWLVETCNGLNLNYGEHGFYADSAETKYYKWLPWALMFNALAPFHLVFRLLSCLAFARTFMSLRRLHIL